MNGNDCVLNMKSLNIRKNKLFTKYRFRCNYCGNETFKPLLLVKLQLLFSDTIFLTCSHCHKSSCYKQNFNLVHDSTNKLEKDYNKKNNWDYRMV